jgi:hypothetical protein
MEELHRSPVFRSELKELSQVRGVRLTTHLHLVPRSRLVELYLHSLICLHGVVLN